MIRPFDLYADRAACTRLPTAQSDREHRAGSRPITRIGMRRWALAFALVCLLPGRAHAGDVPPAAIALYWMGIGAGVGAGAMQLAFAGDDLRMAVRHIRPTRNDGIVELALTAPFAVGSAVVAFTLGMQSGGSCSVGGECTTDDGIEPAIFFPALAGAVFSGLLAGHGIWAIVTGERGSPPQAKHDAPHWTFAPTLGSDGHGSRLGVALVGRF